MKKGKKSGSAPAFHKKTGSTKPRSYDPKNSEPSGGGKSPAASKTSFKNS